MAGGFNLGSLFGIGGANANPLGALAGVTSGLGSGLLGGQSIGGGDASQTIADALGWSYGLGDQTGSTEAQVALGDTGPTAQGTAAQYMQNQQQQNQQNAQEQVDTGQGTPAQRALAQQPSVSLAQAYGPQGPWAPGGSPSPQAASQGPQGFAQVAGPANAAASQPLGTQTPPGGYVAPERSAVTSYGSPVTPGASYSAASPEQMSAARQALSQGLQQRFGATPATPQDQAAVPMPQPRPAAADAAPAQVARNVPPPAPRAVPPAAATPPAANDPVSRATTPPAAQAAAPQNPIQGIMQALGLTNLPPQQQQIAQQIIRQVLGTLMPQLQGLMGGQQGQQFGGGQGQAIDPRTGRPPINPRTGQPYPAGTRWDQIAWSQGWDPAQQKQGVPGRGWEPFPGSTGRSASESGSPTALPPESPPGGFPRRSGPNLRNVAPTTTARPARTAQLQTAPDSWERPMTLEEQRREEMRGMTPEKLKKLRERIKKSHERRIETARA